MDVLVEFYTSVFSRESDSTHQEIERKKCIPLNLNIFYTRGPEGHEHSPDLLNYLKIGQGQLRLIIQMYFVLPYMGIGHFDQVT